MVVKDSVNSTETCVFVCLGVLQTVVCSNVVLTGGAAQSWLLRKACVRPPASCTFACQGRIVESPVMQRPPCIPMNETFIGRPTFQLCWLTNDCCLSLDIVVAGNRLILILIRRATRSFVTK